MLYYYYYNFVTSVIPIITNIYYDVVRYNYYYGCRTLIALILSLCLYHCQSLLSFN